MKPHKKLNPLKFRDYFYLYSLYFKRGLRMSFFYTIMLVLCLVIPGFLIEGNAKIKALLSEVDKKLPPNRVKLVIPPNERKAPQKGLLTSLFRVKAKGNSSVEKRYKDFITPSMLEKVQKTPGVGKIIPLYSIDFPMGIVFAIPGSNTPIQTQMIGTGLSAKDGNEFINPHASVKTFTYSPGQKVPILLSRFIIPVVNTVAQNNGVSNFQLSEKDLIGFPIKIFVGKSMLSDAFSALGNGDEKDRKTVSSVSFSDVVECVIVGFVDMDYSIGLAFPQTFLDVYKSRYWANFQPNYFDSLVVDIPFSKNQELQKKFSEMGFQFGEDAGLFNKISSVLQQQQKWFGMFLQFISLVIFAFGVIILFFITLWVLQGKTLEFSIYQFFGSSARRVVFLYTFYICTLNFIGFIIAFAILKLGFSAISRLALQFQSHVAKEFQSLFEAPFLSHFVVLDSFLWIGFFLLGIVSFLFVFAYIRNLNNKM